MEKVGNATGFENRGCDQPMAALCGYLREVTVFLRILEFKQLLNEDPALGNTVLGLPIVED